MHAVRIAALAAAVVALAGCSPVTPTASVSSSSAVPLDQIAPLADPRAYVGPSTAVLADDAISPVVTDAVQTLPSTVVSHDIAGDTPVTVTSTERVLGLDLAGSIAATIAGLGFADTLVGRDISTDFPGTEELPLVTTDGHSINSEAVIALRPTLVITDGTIGPTDVVLQLRDAGIPVVYVRGNPSLSGAEDVARQVAAAFGAPAAGEALAADLAARTADAVERIAAIAPTSDDERLRIAFLYLRGGSGIYYLFGEGSGADELIRDLGGIDVAQEIGWSGMKPMTDEALIAADPDLILVMSDGLASVGGVDGLLAAKPAVGLTTAGKNKRFVDMADGEILSFGPRLPSVLEALARAVYAP